MLMGADSTNLTVRGFLRRVLEDATRRNPAFSLRAFARQSGLSAPFLSQVLNGKARLSPERAATAAEKLSLRDSERELLTLLATWELTPPGSAARAAIVERLEDKGWLGTSQKATQWVLEVEHFRLLQDWYHLPLFVLAGSEADGIRPKEAARRLGISEVQSRAAMERLGRLGLLKKTAAGTWKATRSRIFTESQPPAEALRKYHEQMLGLATKALWTQGNERKCVGSETVAIDPEALPEIRARIERCFNDVVRISKRRPGTSVYHLGIQLFELTQKPGNRRVTMEASKNED